MTAPVIPNIGVPIAAILIDPVTGSPYQVGHANTPSILPIPNAVALGTTLIDPSSGLPYH